jgi:hypothetical protein
MAAISPSSVRFEPRVLERLAAFVAVHREMTLSSATSRLVDEALRAREHPLITFKDGPAGRRARPVGGPDVWEVVGAVRSVREADPALAGDEVLALVTETAGVPMPFARAALAYWGDYPEEVDAFLDRARAEAAQAQAAWEGRVIVTSNVADFESLRRARDAVGGQIPGLIYTSDFTFPRTRAYAARLATALETAAPAHAAADHGGVFWLRSPEAG